MGNACLEDTRALFGGDENTLGIDRDDIIVHVLNIRE